MNYVLQSLGPNEKIIHVGRFHWFYTAAAIAWIIMGFIGMLGIFIWAVHYDISSSIPPKFDGTQFYDQAWDAVKKDHGGYFKIALNLAIGIKILAFVSFLTGLYFFSRMMVVKASTEIAVTNKRLIYKVGLVARAVGEIDIYRVEGVNVLQGVLGRLFGYGRIIVRGTGVGEVHLPPIANPITFRKAIDYSRFKDERNNKE